MDVWSSVPVREQEPEVRAANFEEVCFGYNEQEVMQEASRCLDCKRSAVQAGVSGFDRHSRISRAGKGGEFCGGIPDHP